MSKAIDIRYGMGVDSFTFYTCAVLQILDHIYFRTEQVSFARELPCANFDFSRRFGYFGVARQHTVISIRFGFEDTRASTMN